MTISLFKVAERAPPQSREISFAETAPHFVSEAAWRHGELSRSLRGSKPPYIADETGQRENSETATSGR